jgi:hypothetical protein
MPPAVHQQATLSVIPASDHQADAPAMGHKALCEFEQAHHRASLVKVARLCASPHTRIASHVFHPILAWSVHDFEHHFQSNTEYTVGSNAKFR